MSTVELFLKKNKINNFSLQGPNGRSEAIQQHHSL